VTDQKSGEMAVSGEAMADGSGTEISRAAREYRKGQRHSAWVKRLKILLPVVSIGLAVAFVVVSIAFRVTPADIVFDRMTMENGVIVMENPALSGQNDDRRTFTMNAARATQNVATPDVITLNDIKAELPVGDNEVASVEAERGIYDRLLETLVLDAPFTVRATGGLEVDLQSARFDMGVGAMETNDGVVIRNGKTSLVAQSVRIRDNGAIIVFERDVRMIIDPSTLSSREESAD
jgi:lipopolysaccharide export system protein LptC